MLHSGEWLVKKYASLAQPKGNQTLDTTLSTLASRLQQVSSQAGGAEGGDGSGSSGERQHGQAATQLPPLADRRAAILTLKGLARDHPVQVGAKALDAILESLCRDAHEDDECARAVVEACLTLCEAGQQAPASVAAATAAAGGKDTISAVRGCGGPDCCKVQTTSRLD